MKMIEPGHRYKIQDYPCTNEEPDLLSLQEIQFVEKVGNKFPGNLKEENGTNCQEILRVLINRCIYLNNQKPSPKTIRIIEQLRNTLYLFEYHAAELKDKLDVFFQMKSIRPNLVGIEEINPCKICGHIYPHSHNT